MDQRDKLDGIDALAEDGADVTVKFFQRIVKEVEDIAANPKRFDRQKFSKGIIEILTTLYSKGVDDGTKIAEMTILQITSDQISKSWQPPQ